MRTVVNNTRPLFVIVTTSWWWNSCYMSNTVAPLCFATVSFSHLWEWTMFANWTHSWITAILMQQSNNTCRGMDLRCAAVSLSFSSCYSYRRRAITSCRCRYAHYILPQQKRGNTLMFRDFSMTHTHRDRAMHVRLWYLVHCIIATWENECKPKNESRPKPPPGITRWDSFQKQNNFLGRKDLGRWTYRNAVVRPADRRETLSCMDESSQRCVELIQIGLAVVDCLTVCFRLQLILMCTCSSLLKSPLISIAAFGYFRVIWWMDSMICLVKGWSWAWEDWYTTPTVRHGCTRGIVTERA